MSRCEHLSLKGHSRYKFSGAFSDSLKPYKHKYLWVAPISSNTVELVATVNKRGEVTGASSPLHGRKFTTTRGRPLIATRRIDLMRTTKRRCGCFEHGFPSPSNPRWIRVKPIVRAKSSKQLKVALDKIAGSLGFKALKALPKQEASQAQGSTNRSLMVAPQLDEEVRTTLVAQGVDDPTGVSSKKRERVQTNVQQGRNKAIDLSDGDSDPSAKKSKEGRKGKSPKVKADYDHYIEDSLDAATQV